MTPDPCFFFEKLRFENVLLKEGQVKGKRGIFTQIQYADEVGIPAYIKRRGDFAHL